MENPITNIRSKFESIPVSPEWCFKNTRSTEQWTHGYHRYPAKFLPNIVKKLIEEQIPDAFAAKAKKVVKKVAVKKSTKKLVKK